MKWGIMKKIKEYLIKKFKKKKVIQKKYLKKLIYI